MSDVCDHIDRKGADKTVDCTKYVGPHRLSSVMSVVG